MNKIDRNKWRNLQEGEVVQQGDLYDKPNPGEGYGWMAQTHWAPVPASMVGRVARSPLYPAHQKFLRLKETTTEN